VIADWRAQARARGWSERDLDLLAELLKPTDVVTEVARRLIAIETPATRTFHGTDRDGRPSPHVVAVRHRWTWTRHEPPPSLTAVCAYAPPEPPAPPVATLESCGCGPRHAEDCEFYTRPPPPYGRGYWEHVRASAARSIAAATARDAAETDAPATAPTKRTKATGNKLDPRQTRFA
jgi:hypothetical protein